MTYLNRLFALLLLPMSFSVYGGPFGLEAGASLEAVKRVATVEATKETNLYRLTRVPVPHEAFEGYMALITPKAGLCQVTGIGRTFPQAFTVMR